MGAGHGAEIPAFFWFLNASPHADRPGAPNHSPEFLIDEAALASGVRALAGVSLNYLTRNERP